MRKDFMVFIRIFTINLRQRLIYGNLEKAEAIEIARAFRSSFAEDKKHHEPEKIP